MRTSLAITALLFSVAVFVIRPMLNLLPFDYTELLAQPLTQVLAFGAMYLSLLLPFFLAGLIFVTVFSEYARDIQSLYFWDLAGAAIGSVILVPLIRPVGPGGLLLFAAAFGLLASACFSGRRTVAIWLVISDLPLIVIPTLHSPQYYAFTEHLDKREVKTARQAGRVEVTVWDPISKSWRPGNESGNHFWR